MKLTPIAANQTAVTFPNSVEVFFSYKTPVAGYHPELGYVRTKKYYSQTTSRHINKYEQSRYQGLDAFFTSVDQEIIDDLVNYKVPENYFVK